MTNIFKGRTARSKYFHVRSSAVEKSKRDHKSHKSTFATTPVVSNVSLIVIASAQYFITFIFLTLSFVMPRVRQ